MSDLLKITKRYNIWLGLISHLRKAFSGKSFEEGNLASIDDIKGSGSIKQISFDIVAFARNLVAESEAERNTVCIRVLKSGSQDSQEMLAVPTTIQRQPD